LNTVYQVDIDIDGTLSSSDVTGTWTDNGGNGYAGTWSGSTAQCSAAPSSDSLAVVASFLGVARCRAEEE
jgi:hypothetical protein